MGAVSDTAGTPWRQDAARCNDRNKRFAVENIEPKKRAKAIKGTNCPPRFMEVTKQQGSCENMTDLKTQKFFQKVLIPTPVKYTDEFRWHHDRP